MCELLAGALTGSGTAERGRRRFCNGMHSLYLTPGSFGGHGAVAEEARTYLAFLKDASPVPSGEVLLPGEPERRMRAHRMAEVVPLPEAVWEGLVAIKR